MSKKRSAWSSHARWSETTAREALNALASSALGPEAFARQHGFSGQRLRQWSKRLGVPLPRRQREERSTALLPVFVRQAEAVPVSIGDSGALTVRVGRAVVQVREPEQIDAVWLARFVSQVGGVA
ncbi:MAG: hypothetical protein IPG04_43330 [Polyangiaceae bacterium]|jgi:hypothetical protein|nr:hypothetical protein [Polyangiaceae bacterium]MBK6520785.1 hypothetical protein [Polyangiaceae bacterium]